ncbi:TatD family hydrolase [Desulfurispira natronophila]|uniref:TatD DNase family protein n=1 Tax=Desulfurispira natronophila TaxID=682562 RepID=A0A7W7Y5A5_9BACT|nr:TatD family hydrolase [Desulfurispira natronophila]MBB5022267.1 TatD DNase family protein [Desulfurispira natronophila]
MQSGFIDSHVHLQDFEELPDSAYSQSPCLIPAIQGEDNRQLAVRCQSARFALGYHPMFLPESIDWQAFGQLLDEGGFCAVGECGLDRRAPDRARQHEVFESQIRLAMERDLPLVIHGVGCLDELVDLSRRYRFRGVLHFYQYKTIPEVFRASDLYFGYCAKMQRSSRSRKLFAQMPRDRILVETDGDAHTPPCWQALGSAYRDLAKLRNEPLDGLVQQVAQNYEALFAK